MAASIDWISQLKNCKLLSFLKSQSNNTIPSEYTNLFEERDSLIFVYNNKNCTILVLNVKRLASDDNANFLTLGLTSSPAHDITELRISAHGCYLALYSQKQVTVVELQGKWPSFQKCDSTKILCKSYAVAERLFRTSDTRLLSFAWHPGSSQDSTLILLTSDNYLRIYCHGENVEPVQQLYLSQFESSSQLLLTRFSADVQKVLGETAVSLCTGSPVLATRRKKLAYSNETSDDVLMWPLYILWGNGEVFVVYSSVDKYQWPLKLQGPLKMFPAAEDNYGSDACSIYHIPSIPPCLALGTCEGKIYHCIVLSIRLDEDEEEDSRIDFSSHEAHSFSSNALTLTNDAQLFHLPIPPNLYVFERLDIQFMLSVDYNEKEEVSCPLHFHKDSSSKYRYHCSHKSGIHSITLPWLQKLEKFAAADKTEESLLAGFESDYSVVAHTVCTTPLPDSESFPLVGVCVLSHHLLGIALVCMSSLFDILVLPLTKVFSVLPSPLLLSQTPIKDLTAKKNLRSQREPFDEVIRKILHKKCTQPLLMSKYRTEPSSKDIHELLVRATSVLQSEYCDKLNVAKQEMEKRLHVLKEQLKLQQSCIEQNNQIETELTMKDEELCEKLEKIQKTQQTIELRLREVMRQLQAVLPEQTLAEKEMHQELVTLNKNLALLGDKIKQLKLKQDYDAAHRLQGSPAAVVPASLSPSTPVNDRQRQNLQVLLADEGKQLAELVQRLHQMKMAIEI